MTDARTAILSDLLCSGLTGRELDAMVTVLESLVDALTEPVWVCEPHEAGPDTITVWAACDQIERQLEH